MRFVPAQSRFATQEVTTVEPPAGYHSVTPRMVVKDVVGGGDSLILVGEAGEIAHRQIAA